MRNCRKLPHIVWFPELLTQDGSLDVFEHIEILTTELRTWVIGTEFPTVLLCLMHEAKIGLPEGFVCLLILLSCLFLEVKLNLSNHKNPMNFLHHSNNVAYGIVRVNLWANEPAFLATGGQNSRLWGAFPSSSHTEKFGCHRFSEMRLLLLKRF